MMDRDKERKMFTDKEIKKNKERGRKKAIKIGIIWSLSVGRRGSSFQIRFSKKHE